MVSLSPFVRWVGRRVGGWLGLNRINTASSLMLMGHRRDTLVPEEESSGIVVVSSFVGLVPRMILMMLSRLRCMLYTMVWICVACIVWRIFALNRIHSLAVCVFDQKTAVVTSFFRFREAHLYREQNCVADLFAKSECQRTKSFSKFKICLWVFRNLFF